MKNHVLVVLIATFVLPNSAFSTTTYHISCDPPPCDGLLHEIIPKKCRGLDGEELAKCLNDFCSNPSNAKEKVCEKKYKALGSSFEKGGSLPKGKDKTEQTVSLKVNGSIARPHTRSDDEGGSSTVYGETREPKSVLSPDSDSEIRRNEDSEELARLSKRHSRKSEAGKITIFGGFGNGQ